MADFYAQPGLHAEIYDAMHDELALLVGDDAFYARHAPAIDGPTLELGCGTGRVTWRLAERGHPMVGLDLSEAMLAIARAKATRYDPDLADRVRFVRGDMTAFELGERFALVIIPFRAFQVLLTPELQLKSLAAIREHLLPGGRLIIDLFDPRLDLCVPGTSGPQPRGEAIHPVTGNAVSIVALHRSNDAVAQVLEEHWRFREVDGEGRVVREEQESLRLRWTYRHEARHLFERAGFEVVAEYSDYNDSPPAYGKEQLWVLQA